MAKLQTQNAREIGRWTRVKSNPVPAATSTHTRRTWVLRSDGVCLVRTDYHYPAHAGEYGLTKEGWARGLWKRAGKTRRSAAEIGAELVAKGFTEERGK